MKRLIPILACALLLPLPAAAQQAGTNAAIQQWLNSPQAAQLMQQAVGGEIDLTQYPGWNQHDCEQNKLAACEAGYECGGADGKGKSTSAHIRGRKDGRCEVSLYNSDGSTGNCLYTDSTIQALLNVYGRQKATVPEAIAIGQRMMTECTFADANGKPLTFGQMRPAGTSGQKGAIQ